MPNCIQHITQTPRYIFDWLKFRKSSGNASGDIAKFQDIHPVLGQRGQHEFDRHYVFLNAWAARRILKQHPEYHIDIGSQIAFATVLSAVIPVKVVEFRPVPINLAGLSIVQGSILSLPFADNLLTSVSSLHVIEHIGLGRYGDPIDPKGTIKSAHELARVLSPGGHLYVGLPIGRPRVCFNAH